MTIRIIATDLDKTLQRYSRSQGRRQLIIYADTYPKELTYPQILPLLFEKVKTSALKNTSIMVT